MPFSSLKQLFLNELKDMYHAENQLLVALPRMAEAAASPALRAAFTKHREETEMHLKRLNTIFRALEASPWGKRCLGMEGLVAQAAEIIKERGADSVLDAALIAAAQKVEHYEIAAYGCLTTYANLLGEREIEKLLKETLAEEEATDEALTALGEGGINRAAVEVGVREEKRG